MTTPDLGIKRICPSCAAKFYDLTKRPIVCPKCAFSFAPESLVKMRRPRAGSAASREDREESIVKAATKVDEGDEDEAVEKPEDEEEEPAEEIKEVALDDETVADPDLVVDEEGDDKEDKPEVVGDEVDLEEIEAEDDDDDEDDDTLIESVDEDEGVADIIDKDNIDKE